MRLSKTQLWNSYTADYWDYIRGLRADEPDPKGYGLNKLLALVIRDHCDHELNKLRKQNGH